MFKYYTLDVFTSKAFGGNQLAVFPNATGIKEEFLQLIARELNLSETTFVYPPTLEGCDYKVRIFTPTQELPMAGHPTLGTAYILAKQSKLEKSTRITLEEGVGAVPVDIEIENGEPGLITMQQPLPTISETFEDRAVIAKLLSLQEDDLVKHLPIQTISCGVPFMIVPINSLSAIEQIKYRLDIWDELRKQHNIPFTLAFAMETLHPDNKTHCRMFAPEAGIIEDPATGSAHGPLGSYLAIHGLLGDGDIKFVSEQGYELGRPSQLIVEIQKDGNEITKVLVGGTCVPFGEGVIDLSSL